MTGVVAWFTGVPSAGKSTLAAAVAGELRRRGIASVMLDSDDIRAMLPTLGYDDTARNTFYALLARLAAHIARQGHVVLVPATAHRRTYRDAARALAPAFLEIFVDTPLDEARRRDTRRLYAADVAAAPGVGTEYESPIAPAFRIRPNEPHAAARIADRIAQSA